MTCRKQSPYGDWNGKMYSTAEVGEIRNELARPLANDVFGSKSSQARIVTIRDTTNIVLGSGQADSGNLIRFGPQTVKQHVKYSPLRQVATPPLGMYTL